MQAGGPDSRGQQERADNDDADHEESGSDNDRDHKFSAKDVQKMLSSKFFHGYLLTLVKLSIVPENLRNWTEGCACHSHIFMNESKHRSARAGAVRYGNAYGAGKQAALCKDGL